jgi:hypothetical protein
MIQVLAIFGIHNRILLKERLQDQFIQKWFSDIDNASGGELYSH